MNSWMNQRLCVKTCHWSYRLKRHLLCYSPRELKRKFSETFPVAHLKIKTVFHYTQLKTNVKVGCNFQLHLKNRNFRLYPFGYTVPLLSCENVAKALACLQHHVHLQNHKKQQLFRQQRNFDSFRTLASFRVQKYFNSLANIMISLQLIT